MPKIILRCLDCTSTESWSGPDKCRLAIKVDGGTPIAFEREVNAGQRWVLNLSYLFNHSIEVKLWDIDDWGGWDPFDLDEDELLGILSVGKALRQHVSASFNWDQADYTLWYDIIDNDVDYKLKNISIKGMLSRLGQGGLQDSAYQEIKRNMLYRCAEVISVKDTIRFHAQQDGGRAWNASLREWLNKHCNPWSEETLIPVSAIPEAKERWLDKLEIGLGGDQWPPVKDEKSRCVAGYQDYSHQSTSDGPTNHETIDYNWDQIPDPAFLYMMDYTSKQKVFKDKIQYPLIENEWENGAMPLQWRPFWGEYVTTWGRHIYDIGHMPVSVEIHPAHSVIRERTSAAPIGANGILVPVNTAVLGMGLCGGFPGNVGSRWKDETGANPPDGIWGDTTDCWVTNLKKHPLKFKLFPPVPRPSPTATLVARATLCEYIQVKDWSSVDGFLELCQYDDPAEGGKNLGFRVWNKSKGLPSGYTPQNAPATLKPKLTLRENAWYDVEIDLTAATQIPVGYYAILECGWSERGNHQIYAFDITFEKVKAVATDETWDDWHMMYGANGQWAAWWTDDFIKEGKTYTRDTRMIVHTIDDMPLSLRDCGIEWDGTDFANEGLDRLEIVANGPNHLQQIAGLKGIQVVEPTNPEQQQWIRFKARAWEQNPSDTKHEWTIKIIKSVL